jgi:hypothetical protein
MNSLDRFMEYLAAGVFLCVGVATMLRYKRRPKALGAQPASLPFGLPYWSILAVGLCQIAAAFALVMPFGLLPQLTLAQVAASGLAGLTLAAAVYRVNRRETAVPSLTLFLLILFVIVGRWI